MLKYSFENTNNVILLLDTFQPKNYTICSLLVHGVECWSLTVWNDVRICTSIFSGLTESLI